MVNETSLLSTLGLSEREARIYLQLLETGETSAAFLSKKLGFTRGTTHFLLGSLAKRGLVSKKGKGIKATFIPASPYRLEDLLKGRVQEISLLQKNLANSLPGLISKHNLAINRPTVRYFEGKEGLKEVFADIYAPTKEIVWGAADIDKIEKEFPGFLDKSLIPKRVEGKLHSKAILTKSPFTKKIKEKDTEQNRESKLVDSKKHPLPAEIDVYENKVAALSFAKNNFVGLIIENEDIATSLKSIFKLAFSAIK